MHLRSKVFSVCTKIKNKIQQVIKENDVELTMLTGLFFISFATYKVNFIAFLYVIGSIFIALSIFLLKFPRGGDK